MTQQNSLRETIKLQIDGMLVELDRLQKSASQIFADERATITAIAEDPRKDILTQTLALHYLFEQGEEGGDFAYITYVVLTALFMLVDTIPLMVKFFCKAGPYDKLLDQGEVVYDHDHKNFIKNHGAYMTSNSNAELTTVTRNKPLEHALVDGVEHSRAARVFLDSMIELEKSFDEKMRLEAEEEEGPPSPEKRQMLDAIKKGFYDDMHKRMEHYFTSQSPVNEAQA